MQQEFIDDYWHIFHNQYPSSLPTFIELGWKEFLNKNSRILEIGYGNGSNLEKLAEEGFENLYGYELPSMIHKLNSSNVQLLSKLDDVINFPKTFDVIMMIGVFSVLGSVEKVKQFSAIIQRKLSQGGALLLCDYHYSSVRANSYEYIQSEKYNNPLATIHPIWSPYPFFHFTKSNLEEFFWQPTQFHELTLPSRNAVFDNLGFNGVFINAINQ